MNLRWHHSCCKEDVRLWGINIGVAFPSWSLLMRENVCGVTRKTLILCTQPTTTARCCQLNAMVTHTERSYAQGKAVWKEIKSTYFNILCVQKKTTYIQKIKTQKKNSCHTTGFIQKPNYLTLLTLIFFDNSFFLNSSSLSTDRKQTVYNRSNPYSTKHSQGKN